MFRDIFRKYFVNVAAKLLNTNVTSKQWCMFKINLSFVGFNAFVTSSYEGSRKIFCVIVLAERV